MQLIRQPEKSTLCGIACVAMITEKSLTAAIQKAIDLFKWDPKTVKINSRTNKKDILSQNRALRTVIFYAYFCIYTNQNPNQKDK